MDFGDVTGENMKKIIIQIGFKTLIIHTEY